MADTIDHASQLLHSRVIFSLSQKKEAPWNSSCEETLKIKIDSVRLNSALTLS
eukprot:Awhi_evm1s9696